MIIITIACASCGVVGRSAALVYYFKKETKKKDNTSRASCRVVGRSPRSSTIFIIKTQILLSLLYHYKKGLKKWVGIVTRTHKSRLRIETLGILLANKEESKIEKKKTLASCSPMKMKPRGER
jgi:hypothetical protein